MRLQLYHLKDAFFQLWNKTRALNTPREVPEVQCSLGVNYQCRETGGDKTISWKSGTPLAELEPSVNLRGPIKYVLIFDIKEARVLQRHVQLEGF